jgi:hypothetical protein
VEARALADRRGRALSVTWGLTVVRVRTQARTQARVQARAFAHAEALAKALALAKGRTQTWALEEEEEEKEEEGTQGTQVGALKETWAERWAEARAEARRQTWAEAQADTFTYGDILADLELMDIIHSISIQPYRRRCLARDLWRSQESWWLIQIIAPITRLPLELLQQILLIIIDRTNHSPLPLMRVCKLWYAVVIGIWAPLKLGTRTPKDDVTRKLERNQRFLDVLFDTEIDRGDFIPSEGAFEAIFSAMTATSRWRTFVVETLPTQVDLPGHLVNRRLQQWSSAFMSRLRTFKVKYPCELSPLLDRLLRVLGNTAGRELTTVTINSANVIAFLVPTYSSIFRSVTVLSLDAPGLRNPVDLLPHLHQLETLTATHLSFPVYHSDVDLPFVHTLRHLTLKSVSVQWMSSRTFHVLESCTILFPLRHHVLHTFCTILPNCKHLTFQGYPLDILHGVTAHNLTRLSVMCPCPSKPLGNRQLVRFSSQALRDSRLAPQTLHISIEAMSLAWTKAFSFMSNLEELVIENAQPSSLGVKVLRSLVAHPVHENNLDTTTTHGGRNTPVCPSLKRFGLRYRRWLRPSERFDLIPDLIFIICSREQSEFPLQSLLIWKWSDQKDPLELIDGSWISPKGFKRLINDGEIEGENLLQLVVSGLWRIRV